MSSHEAFRLAMNPPTDPQTQVPGGIRQMFETSVKGQGGLKSQDSLIVALR